MNKQEIINIAYRFMENSEERYISKQIAISEKVVGMEIFENPIFSFGSADDDLFKLLKKPSIIGENFLLPKEWLPQAKTVISFFLPFSKTVKDGNSRDMLWPSDEWLHGRIEGQSLLNKLCMHLQTELINAGYNSIVPSLDERFWSKSGLDSDSAHPEVSFSSNWSERHAAYICGLGTFGLSKGLITAKGVSGRLGSIITELSLPTDKREYQNIYEYCSMCGACVKNCPASAISRENGKNHILCSEYLNKTAVKYEPRYGCGKCQTCVPCESGIPKSHKL